MDNDAVFCSNLHTKTTVEAILAKSVQQKVGVITTVKSVTSYMHQATHALILFSSNAYLLPIPLININCASFPLLCGTEKLTCTANLLVIPSKKPLFTRKLEVLEATEGRSAQFDCKVSGSPPPEVTWTHCGKNKESAAEDIFWNNSAWNKSDKNICQH